MHRLTTCFFYSEKPFSLKLADEINEPIYQLFKGRKFTIVRGADRNKKFKDHQRFAPTVSAVVLLIVTFPLLPLGLFIKLCSRENGRQYRWIRSQQKQQEEKEAEVKKLGQYHQLKNSKNNPPNTQSADPVGESEEDYSFLGGNEPIQEVSELIDVSIINGEEDGASNIAGDEDGLQNDEGISITIVNNSETDVEASRGTFEQEDEPCEDLFGERQDFELPSSPDSHSVEDIEAQDDQQQETESTWNQVSKAVAGFFSWWS